MDLEFSTYADRPQRELWASMADFWPVFMTKDETGPLYYDYCRDFYAEHSLLAVDKATGEAVAYAHAAPLHHDGSIADGLPEGGWDWAIRQAAHTRLRGQTPNVLCALEIMVRPGVRGSGLSGRMLAAVRDHAAKQGFADLIVPVRPSGASPDNPIDVYAHQQRPDGLPVDPWLRVHVRAGGTIVGVCHRAMVISGSLPQWREWTGLPFDTSGVVTVPSALAGVLCDVAQNVAVYVEPNVWVHHRV